MQDKVSFLKQVTSLSERAIQAVLKLSEEGASIAFMARYRKDQTGNLDEVQILEIVDKAEFFDTLFKRKTFILESIKEQGKLLPELESKIQSCMDADILEDLYLPYKQRKKTKADIAKERGLEPLAKIILGQRERDIDSVASRYLNADVKDEDAAIDGASDIVAQWIADDADTRLILRQRFEQHAIIETKLVKGKEAAGEKYKDYFSYSEKAQYAASHRLMAIMRAEDEGILKFSVEPDEDKTLEALDRKWIRRDTSCEGIMLDITKDAYKRLLKPSLENELKQKLFEKAEEEAIKVFANNLQQLLLSSPLGNKKVMAIDPGIRTGCKTVCLDEYGNLLHETVLYFNSASDKEKSTTQLLELSKKYQIEAIAVGNGTAGRETADIVRDVLKPIPVFLVNEDGASVYSVSEIARKEFPNHDVTVKGAVSIGRRLMDPLAELVKIDAKSIGVGQYQHDVNQNKLKKSLEETVISCVNRVGVNLNTAGEEILKYVSGLGPVLAKNIIQYRNENGEFRSREELKKVARLGDKAFEQCAGFLRIKGAANKLDNSAVHPEQYKVVNTMAKMANLKVEELLGNPQAIMKLQALNTIKEQVGTFTFNDILKELEKPGLDPRESIQQDNFDDTIRKMEDLQTGMLVKGVVTNITNFGAFIDIGIKENGFIHISEMSQKFIKSPNDILTLNQHLRFKVKEIDVVRKRIALTLKFND